MIIRMCCYWFPQKALWDGDWCAESLSSRALGANTWGKQKAAGLRQREDEFWCSDNKASADPMGSSEAGTAPPDVLSWGEGAEPLLSLVQPIGCRLAIEGGMNLDKRVPLHRWHFFPPAEKKKTLSSEWKIWTAQYSIHESGEYWCMEKCENFKNMYYIQLSNDTDLYSRGRKFENNYINMNKKLNDKNEYKDCENTKIFLAFYIPLYANYDQIKIIHFCPML